MTMVEDTLELADVAVADVVQAASDVLDVAATGIDAASDYAPSRSTLRIVARIAALVALVAIAAFVWRKVAGSSDEQSEYDPA